MRALRGLVFLCLFGCGPMPSEQDATVGLSLSLSADLAASIDTLQVSLLNSSATLDCRRVSNACLVDQSLSLVPLESGELALSVPFVSDGSGQSLSLQVSAGSYLVHVEALDASGSLIANGCRPKVDLREGKSTAAELTLQPYSGPACNARRL